MEENLVGNLGMGSPTPSSPYGFNTEFDQVTGAPTIGLGGEGLAPRSEEEERKKREAKKAEDDTLKTLSSMFDNLPKPDYDMERALRAQKQGKTMYNPEDGHWASVDEVDDKEINEYGVPEDSFYSIKQDTHESLFKSIEAEAAKGRKPIQFASDGKIFFIPKDSPLPGGSKDFELKQEDFRESVLPSAAGVSKKPKNIAGSIENWDSTFENVPYNVDVKQASAEEQYQNLDKPFSEDRKVTAGNKQYVIKAGETKQDLIDRLQVSGSEEARRNRSNLEQQSIEASKPFGKPILPSTDFLKESVSPEGRQRRQLNIDLNSGLKSYADITPEEESLLVGKGPTIDKAQLQQRIKNSINEREVNKSTMDLINYLNPFPVPVVNKAIFDSGMALFKSQQELSALPEDYAKTFLASMAVHGIPLVVGDVAGGFVGGAAVATGAGTVAAPALGIGTFIAASKITSDGINKILSKIPSNKFGISGEQLAEMAKKNPEAWNMGGNLSMLAAFRPSLNLENVISGSLGMGGFNALNQALDIAADPDKKVKDFDVQSMINSALTGAFVNKSNFGSRYQEANSIKTQTRVKDLINKLDDLQKAPVQTDAAGNPIPKGPQAVEIMNQIKESDPFFQARSAAVQDVNLRLLPLADEINRFARKNNLNPSQIQALVRAGKLNTETGLTPEVIKTLNQFKNLSRQLDRIDPARIARRITPEQLAAGGPPGPGPSGYGRQHEEYWRERSRRAAQTQDTLSDGVPSAPKETQAANLQNIERASAIVDAVSEAIPPSQTYSVALTTFKDGQPFDPNSLNEAISELEASLPKGAKIISAQPSVGIYETSEEPTIDFSFTVPSGTDVSAFNNKVVDIASKFKQTDAGLIQIDDVLYDKPSPGMRPAIHGSFAEPLSENSPEIRNITGELAALGIKGLTFNKNQNGMVTGFSSVSSPELVARYDDSFELSGRNVSNYHSVWDTASGIAQLELTSKFPGLIIEKGFAKASFLGEEDYMSPDNKAKLPKDLLSFDSIGTRAKHLEIQRMAKKNHQQKMMEEAAPTRAMESKRLSTEEDPYANFEKLSNLVENNYDPSPEDVLELAKMYDKGIGTHRDIDKARELFVMADDIDPKVGGKALADFTTRYNQYIKKKVAENDGMPSSERQMESKPLSSVPFNFNQLTMSKDDIQRIDSERDQLMQGVISPAQYQKTLLDVATKNSININQALAQVDAQLTLSGYTNIYKGINAKTNIQKRTDVLSGMKRAVEMGALSPNGYAMFEFMVNNLMDPTILEGLSVSIAPEGTRYKGATGAFQPDNNKIVLYFDQLSKTASDMNKSSERTFVGIHEVSHYLSQFLPPELKMEINQLYVKTLKTRLDKLISLMDKPNISDKDYADLDLYREYLTSSLSTHLSSGQAAENSHARAMGLFNQMRDKTARDTLYQFLSPDEFVAENMASLAAQKFTEYEQTRKAMGRNSPVTLVAKRKLVRISKSAHNMATALSKFFVPSKRYAGKTFTKSEAELKKNTFEKIFQVLKNKEKLDIRNEESPVNTNMITDFFVAVKEELRPLTPRLFDVAEAYAPLSEKALGGRVMESKSEIRGEGDFVPFSSEAYDTLVNDITKPESDIYKAALQQVSKKKLYKVGSPSEVATSLLADVFFPDSIVSLEENWKSGNGLTTPRGIVFKDPVDYIKHQLDSAANNMAKANGMEVSSDDMSVPGQDTGTAVLERLNLEAEGAVIPQEVEMHSAENEAKTELAQQSLKKISETTINFLNRQSELGAFFSGKEYTNKPLAERQMLSQIASNFYMLNNFNRMLAHYGVLDPQTSKLRALDNAKTAVDNFVIEYGNSEKFGTAESIRSHPVIRTWTGSSDGAWGLSKNTIARVVAPALQKHLVGMELLPKAYMPTEGQAIARRKYGQEKPQKTLIGDTRKKEDFAKSPEIVALRRGFIDGYRKLFEQYGLKFDEKQSSTYYGLYDKQINPLGTQRSVVRKLLDEQKKINKSKIQDAQKAYVAEKQKNVPATRTFASKPVFEPEEAPSLDMSADDYRLMTRGETSTESYTPARGVLESINKPGGLFYWGTHAASLAWTLNAGLRMYQMGNPDAVTNAIGIWLAGTYGLHGIKNAAIKIYKIKKSKRTISIPENVLLPFRKKPEAAINRFIQALKDKGTANAVFDAIIKSIDSKYNLVPFDNRFKLVALQKAGAAATHRLKASASRLNKFNNNIKDPVVKNQAESDMRDFLNPSNKLEPEIKDLMDKKKEFDKQAEVQFELSKKGINVKDERYDAFVRAQKAYENSLNNFQNRKKQIRQAATTRLEKLLDKPLMKDLTDIRSSAVEIQNLWLSSGAIDTNTAQRIEFTLDDHIRKVYLAYQDRDAWLAQPDFEQKKLALINEIANANYSKSGSGISAPGSKADYIKAATDYVDKIVSDVKWFVVNQDRTITDSFLDGAVKGLNKKNLQQRMKLNRATEEFLGLIKNPLVGVVDGQTIDRTALVNLQLSKSLADFAIKAGLAKPKNVNIEDEPAPDGFMKFDIANPEKNPFIANNFWHFSMVPVAQDLVMPGFQNPAGVLGDWFKKIIGLKKASLTVFNTSLWLSQLPSNMVLLTMHGDFLNTRFISNISSLIHGGYVKASDLFDFQPLRKMVSENVVPGEDFERFMKLAYDYGHLSTGTTAFDIREIFKDSDTPHNLDYWMNKAGDAFSIADTAMRFQAVTSRYQQVRDEAIERAKSGGKMLTMEEIFEQASREVYLYYPEMSMLPESIKALARLGILQPFVSFPVNIIRGITNGLVENTKIAVGDDPITRPRATWKLTQLLTYLAVAGSAAINFMFDEEPEKSLDDNSIEAARMLDPENPTVASGVDWKYRDREAGIIEYRDSKQLVPNASVTNIVSYMNRYVNAKTEEEKTAALKAVATQFNDFATLDPASGMVVLGLVETLVPGKTIKNGELVDKNLSLSGLNELERYMASVGSFFRPADMSTLVKLLKADDGSINPTTGKPWEVKDILSKYTTMPIRTISVNNTVRQVTGRTNAKITELREEYLKEYDKTPISGMAIDGMIKKQEDFVKFGKMLRSTMDNAEILGRSRSSVVQSMLSAGIEEGDIASVISRDYGNIMSIPKFTERIVNDKFSEIYKNVIRAGDREELYSLLSKDFRSTWRGYFITSLVDGKSNTEKFNVVSESNYVAKNVNMSELNRKIIQNYTSNATIDMSSNVKKDILNYYQNVFRYLDQFKSWEDFASKHPENTSLFGNFIEDYAKFEQQQQQKPSKIQEISQ